MANNEGSSNEDIGRPGPWKEGRYQQPGQAPDQTVKSPAGTLPNPDATVSTPVTRKDYDPNWDPNMEGNSEPPGGDGG